MPQKRFEEVDILRGVAIILMVVSHSIITTPVDLHTIGWCKALSELIAAFDMHLFFFLSGFVYVCNDPRSFIRKRIRRLIVPFLCFTAVKIVLDLVQMGYSGIGQILTKIIYAEYNWFIVVLFMITALYPFIDKILRKNVFLKLLLAFACLCLYVCFNITTVAKINRVFYYLPYFIVGNVARTVLEKTGTSNINMRKLLISGCCLACTFVFSTLIMERSVVFAAFVIALLAIATLLCFAILFSRLKRGSVSKRLLSSCSRYSLQIYLFNDFIIVAVKLLACNLLHVKSAYVIIPLLTGCTIAGSIAICRYITKKSRFIGKIIGVV